MKGTSDIFLENVNRLLKKLGWTQAELAIRAGVKPPSISQMLNGNHSPTLATLEKIAGAFGLTASQLLSDSDAPGAKPLLIERTSWNVIEDFLDLLDELKKGRIPDDLLPSIQEWLRKSKRPKKS